MCCISGLVPCVGVAKEYGTWSLSGLVGSTWLQKPHSAPPPQGAGSRAKPALALWQANACCLVRQEGHLPGIRAHDQGIPLDIISSSDCACFWQNFDL